MINRALVYTYLFLQCLSFSASFSMNEKEVSQDIKDKKSPILEIEKKDFYTLRSTYADTSFISMAGLSASVAILIVSMHQLYLQD